MDRNHVAEIQGAPPTSGKRAGVRRSMEHHSTITFARHPNNTRRGRTYTYTYTNAGPRTQATWKKKKKFTLAEQFFVKLKQIKTQQRKQKLTHGRTLRSVEDFCVARTKNGERCKFKKRDGSEFCKSHINKLQSDTGLLYGRMDEDPDKYIVDKDNIIRNEFPKDPSIALIIKDKVDKGIWKHGPRKRRRRKKETVAASVDVTPADATVSETTANEPSTRSGTPTTTSPAKLPIDNLTKSLFCDNSDTDHAEAATAHTHQCEEKLRQRELAHKKKSKAKRKRKRQASTEQEQQRRKKLANQDKKDRAIEKQKLLALKTQKAPKQQQAADVPPQATASQRKDSTTLEPTFRKLPLRMAKSNESKYPPNTDGSTTVRTETTTVTTMTKDPVIQTLQKEVQQQLKQNQAKKASLSKKSVEKSE